MGIRVIIGPGQEENLSDFEPRGPGGRKSASRLPATVKSGPPLYLPGPQREARPLIQLLKHQNGGAATQDQTLQRNLCGRHTVNR